MPERQMIKISVNGDVYEFRPGEMTPRIARLVRQRTGMSAAKAHEQLGSDPDVDVVAVLCYAAALQSDVNADWDKLAESMSWLDMPTVEWASDEGDISDPET